MTAVASPLPGRLPQRSAAQENPLDYVNSHSHHPPPQQPQSNPSLRQDIPRGRDHDDFRSGRGHEFYPPGRGQELFQDRGQEPPSGGQVLPPEQGQELPPPGRTLDRRRTEPNVNRSDSKNSVNSKSARAQDDLSTPSSGRSEESPNPASVRPTAQLVRANTDYGPRREQQSVVKRDAGPEENWELRHGWEDQYNSTEYLGLLSSVSFFFFFSE